MKFDSLMRTGFWWALIILCLPSWRVCDKLEGSGRRAKEIMMKRIVVMLAALLVGHMLHRGNVQCLWCP